MESEKFRIGRENKGNSVGLLIRGRKCGAQKNVSLPVQSQQIIVEQMAINIE